jgi:hypothetical protein
MASDHDPHHEDPGRESPAPQARGTAALLRGVADALEADPDLAARLRVLLAPMPSTPAPTLPRPVLLSAEGVAALVSVSESHARRHILPHLTRVSVGGCVRYQTSEVLAWVDRVREARERGDTPAHRPMTVAATRDQRAESPLLKDLRARARRGNQGQEEEAVSPRLAKLRAAAAEGEEQRRREALGLPPDPPPAPRTGSRARRPK